MSSPKIFTYKGIEYSPEKIERLHEALLNDEVIERGGGWKTILEDMENYTPNDFIDVAKKNAETSVIQSAENLWGAAASAVKLFCLQFGVDLKSHNARNVFVKYAAYMTSNTYVEYDDFKEGWKVANRCHSHFYEHEHDGITPAQIHKMIGAVTKFVDILGEWHPKDIEDDLEAIFSEPKHGLEMKYMDYPKQFAGDQWKVKLQVGSKPAKSGPK